MTLTEYLQNAVTELRKGQFLSDPISLERNALADHVETMLAEHPYNPKVGTYWETCAQCCDPWPCPSLRSVATLVSVVTGTPIPEGAS